MFGYRVKTGFCGGEGDGSNVKWSLTKGGTLTISGKGKMTDGKLPWNTFYGELHEKVKQVVFEGEITHIGAKAFYSCGKIEGEVIMPDSVKTVGEFAFYECSGIERIKLSPNLERIDAYAFRGCRNWKGEINLPEGITCIGDESFENCENISGELHFSENLTEIGRCAFMNCRSLTGNLILPDSLEKLADYAFSGCEGINGKIKLPGSIKSIEMNTFSGLGVTGDLVIPDSVTMIGERAFEDCTNLNGTITIGNGVREIKFYAFYGSGLTDVKFGDSLESIGSYVFSDNKSLAGVLKFPSSLRFIGRGAFERCPNIAGIELQDGIEVIADGAFVGLEKAGGTVELPESIWYTGRRNDAFNGSSITNVVYKSEPESEKEYHVKYNGQTDPGAGLNDTRQIGFKGFGGSAGSGMGDEAFVWKPNGKDLTGCGKLADSWLNIENNNLQICRIYKGDKVILANIPISVVGSDAYLYRTEAPFEYKGYTFSEFQFVMWKYGCETCVGFAKDADGNECRLLFGDWTGNADGIWDAYLHIDELTAVYKEGAE